MDAQVHIPGRLLARCVWLLVPLVCLSAVPVAAGEDEAANAVPRDVRTAIKRALPLLEVGSAGAADQRTCFTCHSQAVPLLALAEARRRGFRVDADNFQRQVDHTAEHLRRGAARYRQGKGQGGQVVTAGYALWALAAANFKGDATTTAVTHYLLEYQKDRPHWRLVSRRPPSSGSDFTATALALRGLRRYGSDEQRPLIEQRVIKVRQWLLETEPVDTEDHVFRLYALEQADADQAARTAAADALFGLQQIDGGWAQTSDMQSDAYATGSAIAALLTAAGVAPDDPRIVRGVDYLLRTQLDDGSWHVVTRADGFQTYFESGFPHGEDQFISIAASGWSTLALLLTIPQ